MRREALETIQHEGLTIKIFQDDTPESPREWDNVGTIAFFDKRYSIGDAGHGFDNIGAALRHCLETGAVFLPVHHTDYSYASRLSVDPAEMVKIKLAASNLPADADDHDFENLFERIDGIIFVDADKIRKEFGSDNPEARTKALANLQGEIETYNQFLSGEVYGYEIESEGEKHEDSCWGFYGLQYCIEEAKSSAKYTAKAVRKRRKEARARAKKLKSNPKFKKACQLLAEISDGATLSVKGFDIEAKSRRVTAGLN